MNHQIKYKVMGLMILSVLIYIFCAPAAFASPAAGLPETMVQPDGYAFEAALQGNEWFNYFIKLDDQSVVVKGSDGFWYYGQAIEGRLEAGTVKVSADDAPEDALHLKDMDNLAKNVSMPENAPLKSMHATFGINSDKIKGGSALNDSEQKILVLLIEFNDQAITQSESGWSNEFFSPSGTSVNSYYREVSNGKFGFVPANENSGTGNDGVIKVKLNMNHPKTGSVINENNRNIVKDALAAADSAIDFKTFDINGNGYIENNELHIVSIVAGYEYSYNTSNTPSVWGHRWFFTTGLVQDNVVLCHPDHAGYTQQGERHGDHIATIGILCHELGHDLGLPDLYDTDSSSRGLGVHSLMSWGNWTSLGGGTPGSMPTHLDAWSKIQLGFVTPTIIDNNGSVLLHGTGSSGYNVAKVLTPNPNEYFLLENRTFMGFDAALGQYLENSGIAVWHVDDVVVSENLAANKLNVDENHKAVDLEEANESVIGHSQLDKRDALVYKGYDHYYTLDTFSSFGSYTMPSSILYTGDSSYISVNVKDDSAQDMAVSVRYVNKLPSVYVDPSSAAGTEGKEINISVKAVNHQNSKNIELELNYDSELLLLKNVAPGSICIDPIVTTTTPGVIQIQAQTQVGDGDESDVLTLSFDLVKPGKSEISITNCILTDDYGFPIECTTENGAITVKELLGGSVTGVVESEGLGEDQSGTRVEVEGTALYTYTDEEGNFFFEDVPAGDQVLVFSRSGHLEQTTPLTIVKGESYTLESPIKLLAGDANSDNLIDEIDLGLIKASFRMKNGDAQYNKKADFNEDDKVNLIDLGLFTTNYKGGLPSESEETGKMDKLSIKAYTSSEDGVLTELTDFSGLKRGDTFVVKVSGENAIALKGCDLVIRYNPYVLEVLQKPDGSGYDIQSSTTFDAIVLNLTLDAPSGKICLAGSNAVGQEYPGTTEFIQVAFKVRGGGSCAITPVQDVNPIFIDGKNSSVLPAVIETLTIDIPADPIDLATAAVVQAELSLKQEDVNEARTLVDALEDETVKTELDQRLDLVQAKIDKIIAIQIAIDAIDMLPDSKDVTYEHKPQILDARTKVDDALSKGATNSDITNLHKLSSCEAAITILEILLEEAYEAVEKAEQTLFQKDVDDARDLVNSLPEGTVKTDLTIRLDAVQAQIDGITLLETVIAAIDALPDPGDVELKDETAINTARSKVNDALDKGVSILEITNLDKLTDCEQKLEELKAAEAIRQAEEVATQAVEKAENSLKQKDYDDALALVNALGDGEVKTALKNRLNIVKDKMTPPSDPGTPPPNPGTPPSNPGSLPAVPLAPYTITGNRVVLNTNPSANSAVKGALSSSEFEDVLKKIRSNIKNPEEILFVLEKAQGAKKYEFELPAGVLQNNPGLKFRFVTPLGEIVTHGNMLKGKQSASVILLALGEINKGALSNDQLNAMGNRPGIIFEMKLDGKAYTLTSQESSLEIRMPYTHNSSLEAKTDALTVIKITSMGLRTSVYSGRYDIALKHMTFKADEPGMYLCVYNPVVFNDLKDFSWAENSIAVLGSKGITNGTSKTTFSPGSNITRGDFAVLLVNTLGLKADVLANFEDIPEGTHYTKQVGILKALGITAGTGMNKYSPEKPISRQEAMVLICRALRIMERLGYYPDINLKDSNYLDWQDISPNFVDNINAIHANGISLSPTPEIRPKANATRAEIAFLLHQIY